MATTKREKNRCFPRPPPAEKGRPNGCWYKATLNRLGYYTPPAGTGITDDLEDDPAFRDALYAFQRQATISFGDTEIGPGTTTERMLVDALERTDESAAYVWRTAGDDKVRDEHGMRAGKIYTWNAPPDGDHPGDDYNCRCWAEPLNPAQHPWAVWARERAERREQTLQGLAAPMGLKDGIADLQTSVPLDAIDSTIGPFEVLAGGLILYSIAWSGNILKNLGKKVSRKGDLFTGHGSARATQRKISEKEIQEAIKSAESTGSISTKVGKYNTSQIHYKGSNGVTVIVETEGRNAGKIITTFRH